MTAISTAVQLQLIVLVLFAAGFVLRKLNIVTPERRSGLSDLLIGLILPCNIIVSFMSQEGGEVLLASAAVLLIAALVQAVSFALGTFAYAKAEMSRRKVLRYATIVSNAGFIGNPVVEGVYGAQGALFASVYLIPLRIFMWTAGLSCFTVSSARDAFRKLAKHPCIIAVYIGIALMFVPFELPAFLSRAMTYCSGCLLPVSMLVVGSVLAEVDIRRVIRPVTLYYAGIRLLVIPALTLGMCLLLRMDAMVTGACVILAGMPAGSTTVILAEKYDGDAQYAAECVFLTTVLSLVTIPLLLYLTQMLSG